MPEKPLMGRTDRPWRWHGCLAAWLAALLAMAPAAQRFLPPDPIAVQHSARDGHTAASPAGLQSAQPVGLDILSRLSKVETTFGPAPGKSFPHAASAAEGPAFAPEAAGAPKEAARAGFDRASVGTARTPTGPPS